MKKLVLLLIPLALTAQAQTNYVLGLNGVSDNISLGTSAGNGVRSIEFWFKPAVNMTNPASAPGWTLISRDDNTQSLEYGLYIRGTDWNGVGDVGKLCFFVRYAGVLHEVKSNQNTWNAGTWYHITGVLDATTGMKLYVNGLAQTNTDASGTSAVMTDNSNSTKLGAWGGGRFFNGSLEEVRLWNRAITPAEIQANMCQDLVPANETGLQAYYKFNEGSGSQAADSTVNAYHATLIGCSWLQEHTCLTTSNYVMNYSAIGQNDNMGTSVGNGIRSIEFWFKPAITMDPSTSEQGWTFIARDHATELTEYGVYIRGTDWTSFGNVGHMAFWVRYSGTLHEIFSDQNTWNAGTWYHIAAVLDSTTGMQLYVNGNLQTNTDAAATSPTMADNSNPTYLGSWGASTRYYQGRMDELRIWSRAISQAEVQAKMCMELTPGNETGLKAYYQFNEGNGAVVMDATNTFHGTVNGSTWASDMYCSTGVEAIEKETADLRVYPVPSEKWVILELPGGTAQSSFECFDIAGKSISRGELKGGKNILDCTDLDTGFYFVSIFYKNKLVTKKIVVQQ